MVIWILNPLKMLSILNSLLFYKLFTDHPPIGVISALAHLNHSGCFTKFYQPSLIQNRSK